MNSDSPDHTPRLSRFALIGGTGLLCLTGISFTENQNLHAKNLGLHQSVERLEHEEAVKADLIVSLNTKVDGLSADLNTTKQKLTAEQSRTKALTADKEALTAKLDGTTKKLTQTTTELTAMNGKAEQLTRDLAASKKSEELLKSDVAAGLQRETTLKEHRGQLGKNEG